MFCLQIFNQISILKAGNTTFDEMFNEGYNGLSLHQNGRDIMGRGLEMALDIPENDVV